VVQIARGDPKFDDYWLFTMLACVGEMLEHCDDVSGCVVSLRKQFNRIALWTKTSDARETCMSIGTQLRQILGAPRGMELGYQVHDDSLHSNSSYRNRNKYHA
jgi:translation initiation factor 4E